MAIDRRESLGTPLNPGRMVIRDPLRTSEHWDGVRARAGDIIIATCYKSGTTLVQQIVNLLINGEREFSSMRHVSPWVDSGLHFPGLDAIEALPSPRFLKSHLPFQALPHHPEWRYIYLVRDGRDVCLSLFQHCEDLKRAGWSDEQGQGVDHGPDDFSAFWDSWLETGRPRWTWVDNIDSWWRVRHLSNVMLLHYADVVSDRAATVRQIAEFLELPWDAGIGEMVCRQSSLEHMKALERAGRFGESKVKDEARFINKGTNGRWRGQLTDRQIDRYLALLYEKLEPACADWVCSREGGGPS